MIVPLIIASLCDAVNGLFEATKGRIQVVDVLIDAINYRSDVNI